MLCDNHLIRDVPKHVPKQREYHKYWMRGNMQKHKAQITELSKRFDHAKSYPIAGSKDRKYTKEIYGKMDDDIESIIQGKLSKQDMCNITVTQKQSNNGITRGIN